jgi:hypothetical protein
VHEEAEKLTEAQARFLTATQNAFNALDDKLLQAGIKADELNKDHLGALKKQLELINRQSLDELVHSFGVVSKAADAVFAELKSHWYTFGIGADGAKHALTGFQTQYDSLLAQGRDTEATNLLKGTLTSAEQVEAALKRVREYDAQSGKIRNGTEAQANQYMADRITLNQAGLSGTEKELAAQDALVDSLRAQVTVEQKVAALKDQQQSNARRETGDVLNQEAFKRFKAEADAEKKGQEEADRLWEEEHKKALARHELEAREDIESTEHGTAGRLAAIDRGLKMEERYGLQETAFYRELSKERVRTLTEMDAEGRKLHEQAGMMAAQEDLKMGELELAAAREHAKLVNSTRRVSLQEQVAQETEFANREYALKKAAFAKEIDSLDKTGKDYENKLKALNNKQTELTKQHENEITRIKEQAEEARRQKILASSMQLFGQLNSELTSFVTSGEFHWGRFAQGAITSFLDMALQYGESKLMMIAMDKIFGANKAAQNVAEAESNTGVAATEALASVPWPFNIAAAAETEAMGQGFTGQAAVGFLNAGGVVPGVGNEDTFPAMLTPGEHVADQELTNGLRNLVRNGGGTTNHNVFRPQTTITSLGSSEHLEKLVGRALDNHLRKMARQKGLKLG